MDDVAYDTHLNACRRLVAGSVFDRDNQVSVPGSMFDFQVPMPRGPLPIVLPASSSSDVPDRAEPVMGYVMRVSRMDITWETLVSPYGCSYSEVVCGYFEGRLSF